MMIGSGMPSNHKRAPLPKPMSSSSDQVAVDLVAKNAGRSCAFPDFDVYFAAQKKNGGLSRRSALAA
jgi:hypothetical protein